MKNTAHVIVLGGILGLMSTGPVFGASTLADVVELPVTALLAPSTGFDNNDNVEVVAYGKLPNACYHLSRATAQPTSDPMVFNVIQFATRDVTGACQPDQTLNPSQGAPSPFTSVIPLGQLATGQYTFNYTTPGPYGTTQSMTRTLSVANALIPTIDDLPYAASTTITIPDIINGSDHILVTFSGVLTETCQQLNPNVSVLSEGDVYVVEPTVKDVTTQPCTGLTTPFSRTMDLGRAGKPGYYLIQVRAMNGQAVNKVVEVRK